MKYARLLAFARTLPRIRTRAEAALKKPGLPREKVIVLDAYQSGMTMSALSGRHLRSSRCSGLSADEAAVVQLIEQQMKSA